MEEEFAMAVLCVIFFRCTDSSLAGSGILCLGDDHGREGVVGRRDAGRAYDNSAVTDILLLTYVWVVGAVLAG